ncbi:MAG: response regulator [Thermoleophilaceae bacterium]
MLIAEDNPVNQRVIEALLSKRGFRTVTASDGREALDLIDHGEWAGVLMDCSMPRMDGYETTAEIRRREGPDTHLPIVAMTAHAMEGDRERCLAAGMDDYLMKPVRGTALDAVLERWLVQAALAPGPR